MARESLAAGASNKIRAGGITVLTMVAMAHAVNHAYVALMPILFPVMMADLRFGYSQVGLLAGVTRAFGQGFQWLAGYLARTVRRKVLIGVGSILQGITLAFSGLAVGFTDLLGWQSLNKFFGNAQHPNGNSLILDYFGKEHRGRVLSVHYSGGNAGTVLVPVVGALLLTAFGWRMTLVAFALPGIVIGLLMLWLVNEEQENGDAIEVKEKPTFRRETLGLLKNRNFRLVMSAQATAGGGRGLSIVTTFVPLYLTQHLGLSTINMGLLITLMMVGSVVGPMFAGFLSDRIGTRRPLLITTYLASTVATLTLIHLGHHPWLLPVILFVIGVVVYAEAPILQSLALDTTEGASPDALFGLYYTFGFISAAIWSVIMGAIVDAFGFFPAFYIMAFSYAQAATWIWRLRLARQTA